MMIKEYRNFRNEFSRLRKQLFNSVKWNLRANILYYRTIARKECYFGPFTGEFGHLLGHNLPFISYLHSRGVKVHFCGMEIHRPFFVDEQGNEIVASYTPLRDFFHQFLPNCNTAEESPEDINIITRNFIEKAKKSRLPYWDNSDFNYYFDFYRWWVLKKKYLKTYDLSQIYKTKESNSVVIFPRKINPSVNSAVQLINNGEAWNYFEIAKIASEYFDKVYVIGHPSFTDVNFESFDNIEICITNDNSRILELCSNSRLIISQHSGAVYLGEYTDCPVLIIYKGGNVIGNIKITKRFKLGLGTRHEFRFAYSYNEIEDFFNKMTHEKVRD